MAKLPNICHLCQGKVSQNISKPGTMNYTPRKALLVCLVCGFSPRVLSFSEHTANTFIISHHTMRSRRQMCRLRSVPSATLSGCTMQKTSPPWKPSHDCTPNCHRNHTYTIIHHFIDSIDSLNTRLLGSQVASFQARHSGRDSKRFLQALVWCKGCKTKVWQLLTNNYKNK